MGKPSRFVTVVDTVLRVGNLPNPRTVDIASAMWIVSNSRCGLTWWGFLAAASWGESSRVRLGPASAVGVEPVSERM